MHINTVQKVFLVVGTLLLLIAMWANVNLYVSLASTLVDKATWALMGLLFDVIKILSLIVGGVLFSVYNRPFAALLAFVFWAILTLLSLSTLFGYTSKVTQESERVAAVESMTYKSAQATAESSSKRLESLASYATIDVASVTKMRDDLAKAKADAESTLAACPRNYITNCIRPAKAKIAQIDAALAPLEKELTGYREYQGALSQKNGAIDASKAALIGGASAETLHPMFTNGATLARDMFHFSCNGNQLKIWFLALSAVLCELLASYALYLVSIFGGRNLHSVNGVQAVQPQAIGAQQADCATGNCATPAAAIPKT